MDSRGTILLADDEDTFLEATKDLLEEEGYVCQGVRNASELSAALKADHFDLLITDLNMPGNRIMEKVSELREQSKLMPVIVVTGYPSVPTAVESIRLNVLEYMIKPVNFPLLLETIQRGIEYKNNLATLTQARKDAEHHTKNLSTMEEALSSFQVPIDEQEVTRAVHAELSGASATQPPPSDAFGPSAHDYFRLRESVFHTIQVLQKTKSAFRSKDLAGLRKYLEEILKETSETLKDTTHSTDTPS